MAGPGGSRRSPTPPPAPVRRAASRWPGRRTPRTPPARTTSGSRPAAVMVRPPSATAAPAASRSRPVIRAPEGSCGIDSVNDDLRHSGSRQRHRRLCHTSRAGTGNATSRGPVSTRPFTELTASHTPDTTAAPAGCPPWTGAAPGSRPGRARPDRPPHRPAPPTTSYRRARPSLFLIDCFSNSHDHEGLRAPHTQGHTTPEATTPRYQPVGANHRCPAKIEDPVLSAHLRSRSRRPARGG